MPATLYLVRTAPGLEREVEQALARLPGVAACAVLFEGHVAVRVGPGPGPTEVPAPAEATGRGAEVLPEEAPDAALAGVAGVESAVPYG